MALENHFFPYFTIIVLSVSTFCTSSHINYDHEDHLADATYLQEESGYDFRAYPSYFAHLRGVKFETNHSIRQKFRRSLATSVETFNVLERGAKGDGNIDDTEVFQEAWTKACSSSGDQVNFVVPQDKNYLLKPIRFRGPCKSNITTMQIAGTIIASNDRSDYSEDSRHWLVFDSVQNLVVTGGGIIDGNGNIWWQNSCKINKAKRCKTAPTALTFYKCANLTVNNLKITNAQQMHMSFEKSTNVVAYNLAITSPENSPNTDGIHITDTQNIRISNCTIGTGDDCISIVNGSQSVRAMGITCGPGHGISIGSLGSKNSEEYVSDVVVDGAKLSGTKNGVRIKTWQGGSGSASNISFQNIEMQNVENPIIIDQNYCDQDKPCHIQDSAVQVKNIAYQNIRGTSASDVAIDFDCSSSHPCEGIVMQNVILVAENGENAKAICKNVNFTNIGTFSTKFLNSGSVSPRCP